LTTVDQVFVERAGSAALVAVLDELEEAGRE